MTEDEKIDILLRDFPIKKSNSVFRLAQEYDWCSDRIEARELSDRMYELGLIEEHEDMPVDTVSKVGKIIDNAGGWLVEVRRLKDEQKEMEEVERASRSKILDEAKTARFKKNTMYAAFIFACLMVIFALIATLNELGLIGSCK